METQATPVSNWTEEEVKCIAMYQEKAGLDRKGAIQRMRRAALKGVTAAQQLEQQNQSELDRRKPAKPAKEVVDFATAEEKTAHEKKVAEVGSVEANMAVAKPRKQVREKESKPRKQVREKESKPKRKAGDSAEAHLSPQKMTHIDELVRKTIGKDAVEAIFKSSLSEQYTKYIWFGLASGRVLSVNPDKMETRWLADDSKSVKAWHKAQAKAEKREQAAAKAEAK